MSYEDFVAAKLSRVPPTGMVRVPRLHESLFPFQRDLVTWALKRGRAAIFAQTGLGKSRVQIEWARCVAKHTKGRVLILAPLAVAAQTVREAAAIGVDVTLVREPEEVPAKGIAITNYERLHKINAADFAGVVLDESSRIKHEESKTLALLMAAFEHTPFKLCATATPAPNDYTELGTHAEFLGICSRVEMLAEYFCHDGGETQVWRLKGHARDIFWRWVATWGALVRKPSDLGYDDGAYDLPPLRVQSHTIAADHRQAHAAGMLFVSEASSLSERRAARRASMGARVEACAARVAAEPGESWVVWCALNDEQDALEEALGDQAVSIRGATDLDERCVLHDRWLRGDARVLVSKSAIFGWGLNWQHCARMAFVGVDDSWESYYQAIRRCWRFGQKRPVDVHIFASEIEGAVVANLERKERDALAMAEQLSQETRGALLAEVRGLSRATNLYQSRTLTVPTWMRSAS